MLADLDMTDRRILHELDWDARQPDAQIAKKLRISRSVVGYRIRRLEERGFINGYYTVIDSSKLGYYTAAIRLELLGATQQQTKELNDFLIGHETVFYVSEVDGDFDASFGVWVKDIYSLETFLTELKKTFRSIILTEHVSLFTRVLQYPRSYLVEQSHAREVTSFGKSEPVSIDELDKKLLMRLAEDARVQTVTLSQEFDTPARTIAYRIRQLDKSGVIQHYRALIDFSKYGYQYFKVDMELSSFDRLEQLKEYIRSHPNIVYHEETVGGKDFEFDIEIPDKQELITYVNAMRTQYPEIRRWKYYTIFRYKKIKYCPQLL